MARVMKLGMVLVSGGLVACVPQQPAPVVSGYKGGAMVEVAAPARTYVQPEQTAEVATVEGQRYSLTRQKFVPVAQSAQPVVAKNEVAPMVKEEVLAKVEPAAGVPPQKVQAEEVTLEEVVAEPAAEVMGDDQQVGWVEHKVEKGETIYKISKLYEASVFDIMAVNEFEKPQDLKAGTLVRVPVRKGQKGVTSGVQPVQVSPEAKATLKPAVREVVEQPVEKPMVKPEGQPVVGAGESATGKLLEKFKQSHGLPERVEQLTAKALGEDVAPKEQPLEQVAESEVGNGSNTVKGAPTVKAMMEQAAEKPKGRGSAADELRAELKRGQIDPVAAKADGRVWPVKGKIIRNFGEQGNGVAYSGISIAVPPGTPVLAMDGGTVLYADEGLKTYGKLVLVQHKNGMISAYAHNGHLLVRKGERVKKGQIIATSGASGNVGTPQLHFELRQHASAVDPLKVLPKL